ncbi:ammonium transporter [Marinomonas rhizomae]|uniref:Diguanylate cyclase/phosphodiesterase with PAS/PAC sensor(S) /ammonium transporter n=1 Tax=Marinomonas rhizomae TaxID=491948 RepID=A0A366IVD5_9GAMM|nr:ammonium transporter [Marinomonas rhizomae]RBP78517.1 diguanylate cyclase/phosphodiesterase with PAS/PAC sensor(s) /ammonium transporter [Marinomonas rhizomae]RNF70088.1 ammonium transporter [Marinomonas rhizomae]
MAEYYWLLVASTLVFMMQAGFLCLESGRIRSKNSINVAAKNISDFIISTTLFWLFGFGIMFGDSVAGLFGASDFFFDDQHTAWEVSFFLFQMMFCGTAATLTSGAVAERMTFIGYVAITVILSAFIYPIVGHWVWSSIYPSEGPDGWLAKLGFIDFAGSTVVHSVGGWVALAAIIIIGPRLGRFEEGIRLPPGNNLPLSALGTLLIWFGWIGFNGGSTLALTDAVPMIILNTFISAAWGALIAAAINYFRDGYIEVGFVLNGTIAGLVGITASCHVVSPGASVIIGAVSGVVVYFGSLLMERWRLDDALDVVPAHLFAGIWGTLSVALFGQTDKINNGLGFVEQLGVQALGIVVIGFYCFVVGYVGMWLLNRLMPLRASKEQEEQGLNVAEHRATTELFDLLTSMQYQQNNADFSKSVPEEPFTEVGQIARKYNQVIDRVSTEIAQRDNALMRFQESEMRKSAILNSSMDCIVTINRFGSVIEFNPAAERTFGCLKKQVEGKSFIGLFIREEDRRKMFESLNSGFSTSNGLILNRRNPFRLQRSPNNDFPAEIAITKANADSVQESEYTLHIRDMTRHVKLQERLKFLAYSDPLTSLYNRTYLMDSLVSALLFATKQKTSVGLLFLDLDNFKIINDTLGHKAGDELLCEVARRLIGVSEQCDVIARWGGDEFVFMMTENVTESRLARRAQQILEAMRAPVHLNEQYFTIPTSIGVAHTTENEQNLDADKLIQQADIAMYWAKEKGRDNAQFFTSEMANIVTKKFGFEKEINDALALAQFSLVYQPKVLMEKANILGLEALIRWNHPTKGRISPADFISIAEESNLIIKIDEWVIDQALQQQKAWRDQGLRMVPIAVNLSGRHLVSDSLVSYISQKLEVYNVEGYLLEIEITEGVLLQDIQRCIEVMAELKALDIKISVDDFGTGYSSLSYLKRLPLDVLKIDQSFVEECDSHIEDTKICETIIHLARSLELRIVAEGVETAPQADMLKSLGCEVFQGYYFHKPMEGADIAKLLTVSPVIA